MFCQNCGKEIDDNAVICVNCGCATQNYNVISENNKSFVATLLLCFFLGMLGIHRFYTGFIGSGVAQLLMTCSVILSPITLIWVFIDFIIILCGSWKTSTGDRLI